jgi:hypothetical protein
VARDFLVRNKMPKAKKTKDGSEYQPTIVGNGYDGELEIVPWYSATRKEKVVDIRSDILSNSGSAGLAVSFYSPERLRRISSVISCLADWMEDKNANKEKNND